MSPKELLRLAFGDQLEESSGGPVLRSLGQPEPEPKPEPCPGCAEHEVELELRTAEHEAASAELRRRITNQATSLAYPRIEDVITIGQLQTELARLRFLSVLRGKLADAWSAMLQTEQTELAEVKQRLADLGVELEEKATELDAMKASKDEAYRERNRLVAFVARVCMPTAGIRRTDIPGWDPEWHGCVFIETTEGQLSWHYHDSEAPLFASLPAYEKPWDGHTTAEKYARLWRLTELTERL